MPMPILIPMPTPIHTPINIVYAHAYPHAYVHAHAHQGGKTFIIEGLYCVTSKVARWFGLPGALVTPGVGRPWTPEMRRATGNKTG